MRTFPTFLFCPYPLQSYAFFKFYVLRIASPFVKEQTTASAWLLCRDVSLPVFNKLSQVSTLLGEQVENTASERVMAIIGDFRTLKGNFMIRSSPWYKLSSNAYTSTEPKVNTYSLHIMSEKSKLSNFILTFPHMYTSYPVFDIRTHIKLNIYPHISPSGALEFISLLRTRFRWGNNLRPSQQARPSGHPKLPHGPLLLHRSGPRRLRHPRLFTSGIPGKCLRKIRFPDADVADPLQLHHIRGPISPLPSTAGHPHFGPHPPSGKMWKIQ